MPGWHTQLTQVGSLAAMAMTQIAPGMVAPRPSWDDFGVHHVSSQIRAQFWAPRVTRGAVRQVLVA